MNKLLRLISANVIKLFVVVNFCFVLIFLFFLFAKPTFKELKSIDNYIKEYMFEPTYNSGFINIPSIEYPTVEIAPFDIRYLYIPFKEARDLKNHKYDELFYANKRVAELLKWGNEIPSRSDSLAESSAISNLADAAFTGKLSDSSWEKTLGKYYLLMDRYEKNALVKMKIGHQAGLTELMLFSTRLRSHIDDINLTILNGPRSNLEKRQLIQMTNKVFTKLQRPIADRIPVFNPAYVYFNLSKVIHDREFGKYDIIIDNIPIPNNQYEEVKFTLGDKRYNPESYDPEIKELSYKNVNITSPKSYQAFFKDPSLSISTKNLTDNLQWSHSKNRSVYTADFFSYQSLERYYLKLKSNYSKGTNFKIEHIYTERINNRNLTRKDTLVSRSMDLKYGNSSTFEDILQLRAFKTTPTHFRVTLESGSPLTTGELQSIKLEFLPFYSPSITLKKNPEKVKGQYYYSRNNGTLYRNSYKLRFLNTTNTEESFILNELGPNWRITNDVVNTSSNSYIREVSIVYYPILVVMKIFVFFNWALLFFVLMRRYGNKLKNQLIYISTLLVDLVVKITNIIAKKLRYLILIIAVSGTFIDLFIMRPYSDVVLIMTMFLWFFVIVGFNIDPIKISVLNLILLMGLPLILITGNVTAGEKLAIYTITSIMSMNLYFIFKPDYSDARISKKILLVVHRRIGKLATTVNSPFALALFKTRALLGRVFNIQPRNRWDHIRNLLTLIAIILLLFLLIFVVSAINEKISADQNIQRERIKREMLNPNISTVEPRIVYQSTKILILGNGFGFNDDGSSHLMSNVGEVRADLWTNEKIIFTVPLDWKPERITLWITKKTTWKGRHLVVTSEIFDILLIPRTDRFTSDDDMYFEQLKKLKNETLILNGYAPDKD